MENNSPIKEISLTCLGAGVWALIMQRMAPYAKGWILPLFGSRDAYGILSSSVYLFIIFLITCLIALLLYKRSKYFILGALAYSFAQVVILVSILR